jgi:hypothetical protein
MLDLEKNVWQKSLTIFHLKFLHFGEQLFIGRVMHKIMQNCGLF